MWVTTEGMYAVNTVVGDAVVSVVMYGIAGMVVAKILHEG